MYREVYSTEQEKAVVSGTVTENDGCLMRAPVTAVQITVRFIAK